MTSQSELRSRVVIDQSSQLPAFLITIDTEGDNIWSHPKELTTRNSRYLGRFQALCEKYGLKPTYLTNYEMAICPDFQEFGRDLIRRGTGEIGMHLHAWNSPPVTPVPANSYPYLIEYPREAMHEKVSFMTDLLEDVFRIKMRSHRAGRWAFNETYAQILSQKGYSVDCSVTPHVSWARDKGFPDGNGGTDYTDFPDEPYFLNLNNIKRTGTSSILEIPMTITASRSRAIRSMHQLASKGPKLAKATLSRVFPAYRWFRPTRRNLPSMLRILRERKRKGSYIEFMLHSSEFMPGGSPNFPDRRSIEILYEDLESVFSEAQTGFKGATLTEYYHDFSARHFRGHDPR